MVRNWKTGEPIEDAHELYQFEDAHEPYQWEDLILEDQFGITQTDWNDVIERASEHVQGWPEHDIAGRISCIIDLLMPRLQTLWQGKDGKNGELSFRSFRWLPCCSLPGATVADHALTASAIAYCLGYDNGFKSKVETLNRLRLSALTATWKNDGLGDIYDAVWAGLLPIEGKADGDVLECIVYAAKTVASKRLSPCTIEQFDKHPLKQQNPDQKQRVGLVLGGATKIKDYFLESAKLPEIRGASALLDRINLEDIPVLLGHQNLTDPEQAQRIRANFCERTGHSLSAPECIIYAAGGNTLAFTPASLVNEIADEIERIYTQETLIANSVAVGDTFDLLELQYGLNPEQFWLAEFREACKNSKTLELMEGYYGGKKDKDFFNKKCFGELTTKLARAQLHRRAGNPTSHRTTQRDRPAHVEIGAYQQRCESCERRPAIIRSPRILCEACTRKYVAGRVTKRESDIEGEQERIDYYLKWLSGWQPATRNEQGGWCLKDWSSLFKEYLKAMGKETQYLEPNQTLDDVYGPQDLKEIADASHPSGFVTFIYADGNNMGGYLEKIETPAQYRQFSERAFIATQKAAFEALAKHLSPTDNNLHPFEIVSIGGDDLLLIVPGSKAFEVVHELGKNFDREFDSHSKFADAGEEKLCKSQRYVSEEWLVEQQKMQPAISLSLGFVIANEHTPIAFLEHLATNLLKSAKTRAKKLKTEVGYSGGTVDFISLKSLSMITSELSDFRKKFYKTDEKNILTMRPFTLHELYGFIQTVRGFKGSDFPRSQLYRLRQSLTSGRHTSTLEYLYFRSRLRDDKRETLQKEIESNWRGAPDIANGLGPWYAMPKRDRTCKKKYYETLLFDLIEAYEFIPESSEENRQ